MTCLTLKIAYNKITLWLKGGNRIEHIYGKKEEVKRDWYVIDASNKPLGRLASKVAIILRGKHKPIYTPHVDTGDYVVIVNADKAILTGNKMDKKFTINIPDILEV